MVPYCQTVKKHSGHFGRYSYGFKKGAEVDRHSSVQKYILWLAVGGSIKAGLQGSPVSFVSTRFKQEELDLY